MWQPHLVRARRSGVMDCWSARMSKVFAALHAIISHCDMKSQPNNALEPTTDGAFNLMRIDKITSRSSVMPLAAAVA